MRTIIESPIGTQLSGSFIAGLGGPDDQQATLPTNNVEFIRDVTIGELTYENVVHIDSFDGNIDSIYGGPAASIIDRLTYAHEFGLVSYVDSNQNRFTRTP